MEMHIMDLALLLFFWMMLVVVGQSQD